MSDEKRVIGWKLERTGRRELLLQFPPRYQNVVADHVTFQSGVAEDSPLPEATEGAVVGKADDGAGVEALVIAIDGSTDRPDGSTWHVTWSLAPGREARESNQVIAERGWAPLELPMTVQLEPKSWPKG